MKKHASGDTVCYSKNNVHMQIIPSATLQVVSRSGTNKKKKNKKEDDSIITMKPLPVTF